MAEGFTMGSLVSPPPWLMSRTISSVWVPGFSSATSASAFAGQANAVLVGGQASYTVNPNWAVVGTFGWSPSKDKLSARQDKLDLYQYDLGVEGRLNDLTAEWTGGRFDASGKHFYVSVQHNMTGKGVILDITGWK